MYGLSGVIIYIDVGGGGGGREVITYSNVQFDRVIVYINARFEKVIMYINVQFAG